MSFHTYLRATLSCWAITTLGMGCKTGAAETPQHDAADDCTAAGSGTTHLTDDRATTRRDASGKEVVHVGKPFEEVPAVSVAELLANPDAYKDRTVQISGHVSAMCHHMRGWFAVVGNDQSGRHIRVFTAPAFLVPDGAIGKTARAQGKVEVVEISAEHAAHLAAEHQIDKPEQRADGPVKRVILRATGADFS